MAYNPNIPAATDQLSVSQGQIRDNFQALNPIITGVVNFPASLAAPAPTGNNIIFALNYVYPGPVNVVELYIQSASGVNTPFTAALSSANMGWTYLPSGMKMVWGHDIIAIGQATKTTLFSSVTGFPGFTTASLGIAITRVHNANSNNFITLQTNTNLQFIARKSGGATGAADEYAWFAVGR